MSKRHIFASKTMLFVVAFVMNAASSFADSAPKTLTKYEDVQEALRSERPTFMFVSISSCGHCPEYYPMVEALQNDRALGEKFNIIRVNEDDFSDEESFKMKALGVTSYPAMIYFVKGWPVGHILTDEKSIVISDLQKWSTADDAKVLASYMEHIAYTKKKLKSYGYKIEEIFK